MSSKEKEKEGAVEWLQHNLTLKKRSKNELTFNFYSLFGILQQNIPEVSTVCVSYNLYHRKK